MQRKKSVLGLFGLVLVCFIAFTGCDNDNNNNDNNQGFLSLARMDIEDANTVFIAPNPETSKDDLYKITDSGKVEEVTYFDEAEKEMPMNKEPSAVYNAGPNYVIVCYGYNEGYLIRKNDGAVFSLNTVGIPYGNSMYVGNRKAIFTDNISNIYYRSGGRVLKINIQNPENLTREVYSPSTDSINGFIMDNIANILYFGQDGASNEISRIKKNNGGLMNLENPLDGRVSWVGPDNFMYYIASPPLASTQVKKYNRTTDSLENFGLNMSRRHHSNALGVLNFNDRVLLCGTDYVFEVYPTPNIIHGSVSDETNYQALGLRSIKCVGNSNNYYYLAGSNFSSNPVLLKINVTNNTPTTLLSGYDIYKMTVSPNDVVTFNALQMSNGAIIIGEISSSGQMRILDATLNTEVSVLERIR